MRNVAHPLPARWKGIRTSRLQIQPGIPAPRSARGAGGNCGNPRTRSARTSGRARPRTCAGACRPSGPAASGRSMSALARARLHLGHRHVHQPRMAVRPAAFIGDPVGAQIAFLEHMHGDARARGPRRRPGHGSGRVSPYSTRSVIALVGQQSAAQAAASRPACRDRGCSWRSPGQKARSPRLKPTRQTSAPACASIRPSRWKNGPCGPCKNRKRRCSPGDRVIDPSCLPYPAPRVQGVKLSSA